MIPLDGKTAGAANSSPFTITPADTDFYEYTMTGITASTTIKFTTEGATSDKRAIILVLISSDINYLYDCKRGCHKLRPLLFFLYEMKKWLIK